MTNTQNDLYKWSNQLPEALWQDLDMRPVQMSAENTGAELQNGVFRLTLIGKAYSIDPKNRRIWKPDFEKERVSYQAGVVLLTTLAHSKGVPPSGRMKTPLELPGGSLFFTGAHALATKPIEIGFGRDPEKLLEHAEKLGGRKTDGADMAVCLPGLPLVPLYVLLWIADEEFDARAVIGIDERAIFHLDLAGIFALCNLLVSRIVRGTSPDYLKSSNIRSGL